MQCIFFVHMILSVFHFLFSSRATTPDPVAGMQLNREPSLQSSHSPPQNRRGFPCVRSDEGRCLDESSSQVQNIIRMLICILINILIRRLVPS